MPTLLERECAVLNFWRGDIRSDASFFESAGYFRTASLYVWALDSAPKPRKLRALMLIQLISGSTIVALPLVAASRQQLVH